MKRATKRKLKRAKKKVKKQAKYQIIIFFYRTLYLAGLTAIIPAVVINAAPSELGFFSATPFVIMATAIALMIFSVLGILKLHKTKKDAFISMAWTTLFPGFIALAVSLGARPLLTSIVNSFMLDFSKIDPLITLYIDKALPQVWFLTLGYVAIGGLWYLLAKAVE